MKNFKSFLALIGQLTAENKIRWTRDWTRSGMLRCHLEIEGRVGLREFCPLTLAAWLEEGEYYPVERPGHAGNAIGLCPADVSRIIRGADFKPHGESPCHITKDQRLALALDRAVGYENPAL
jgi:hypothetical protein